MHYKKYSKNEKYNQLEIIAKQKKVGMWSLSNMITPWDFRKPK